MNLAEHHARLKATRGRGEETASHLQTMRILAELEHELNEIRHALNIAWREIESKDARKCYRHVDHAQQRMHRVIKRLQKAQAQR